MLISGLKGLKYEIHCRNLTGGPACPGFPGDPWIPGLPYVNSNNFIILAIATSYTFEQA